MLDHAAHVLVSLLDHLLRSGLDVLAHLLPVLEFASAHLASPCETRALVPDRVEDGRESALPFLALEPVCCGRGVRWERHSVIVER